MATVYSVVFKTVGFGFFGGLRSRSESLGVFSTREKAVAKLDALEGSLRDKACARTVVTREADDSLSMYVEGVCMDPGGWGIVPLEMDEGEPHTPGETP